MWEYEYAAETSADAGALWRLWTDIESWPRWNAGIARIEVDGPFAVGTVFRMTAPGEDEPIEMRITEVVPGVSFTDVMDAGEFVVTTEHRIEEGRVVYRTEITGPAAGEVGPQLGPAITGDFPDVVAALVEHAQRAGV